MGFDLTNKTEEMANNVTFATAKIILQITDVQFKHFKMLLSMNVEMIGKLLKQAPSQMLPAPTNPVPSAPIKSYCRYTNC